MEVLGIKQPAIGMCRRPLSAVRPIRYTDVSILRSFGPCLIRNLPPTVSQIQPE
jgi:hypothetical protein